MTTTLFPPVVETYIPAFLRDSGSCRVYFNFSQFNTEDDIAGVHLIVRNQYTNKNMLNPTSYPAEMKYYKKDEDKKIIRYDSNINKYYIILGHSDLISGFEVNESYKVQLRFIDKSINDQSDPDPIDPSWINDNLQNFSEWSTVGIIRGISTPFLSINNFSINDQTDYNDLTLVLSGRLSFSDIKEKDSLQSYVVTLSSEGKVIEKSEKVYTNSLNPNTIYYEFKKLLESGGEYTLKFEYTTRAKYQSSATYYLKAIESNIALPDTIQFTIESNQERGSIFITIENLQDIATNDACKVLISDDTIRLRVRRTSSKSDFTVWETMQEIVLYIEDFNAFRWEDCTVESGVWYRYGFLLVSDVPGADIKYSKFFTYGDLEGSNKEDYIFCPFEDMFLVDKKSNLRIQFNQSVDSMKYVQTENIITTLGSKYPYIIKGGDTKYKQFNISGMISVLEDIEGIQSCACGPDSQKKELKTDYSNIFFKKSSTIFKELFNNNKGQKISLYDDYKTAYNISPNNDYVIEKLFRDKVMEFLTDNDVKLFKTMTEGNILVKLTNVSFTPNKTLGRNIYSFSATATEIAEDSVDNYNKFNIVRTDLQTGHFEYMLILPQETQGSIQKDGEAVEYDIKTKTAEISRGYGDEADPHFRLIPIWIFDEEE